MTDADAPSGAPSVKSARRVIELLELFSVRQRPLTLTAIAAELGYPPSSALALLRSLQTQGYVAFDPLEKHYAPTMRVAMLGGWIQGALFQEGAIVALMTQLQRETGETVYLAMQNDIHAQYVHSVQSQELLRFYLRPGVLRPICASAVGWALLSVQSEADVDEVVDRVEAHAGRWRKPVDRIQLRARLARVRNSGYAYSDRLTDGVAAVAIVLPERINGQVMALGVGGPIVRMQPKVCDMVPVMKELAVQYLSRQRRGGGRAARSAG